MEFETSTMSAQNHYLASQAQEKQIPTIQIGRWGLIDALGSGSTSEVFLGIDPKSNEIAAIKLMWHDSLEKKELIKSEILSHYPLNHSNIIQLKEFYECLSYIDEDGETRTLTALVLEHAEGGDLFELIQMLGRLPEILARTYFEQLLGALEYIHAQGIIHRDLKIDNLLLDSSLSLKLADFGYAGKYSKEHKTFDLAGTSRYLAPELRKGIAYDGAKAEIFSAGIILFSMVVGWLPFKEATENDELYRLILAGDFNAFWKCHEESKFCPSEEFKNMMNQIFEADPEKRSSIQEIRKTSWMSEQALAYEDIQKSVMKLVTKSQ